MARIVARQVTVRGRVQGVFFRVATRQTASRVGVTGWVVNLPDGSVRAWLEGPADDVETVEAWISTGGPPAADVTDIEAVDVEPQGHVGFEVRHDHA